PYPTLFRSWIARCRLHEPGLLILDEPADGLDPRGRNDLRRILERIRARGVTIVISSHILRELDDLCDQVGIIQHGRLAVAGDVDRIIDSHEVSRFVYELRILADHGADQADQADQGADHEPGLERALERLTHHRALVEQI